jgi:hypothetical protein
VPNDLDVQGSGKNVFWGEISPSEHFVQIYEDDTAFMDTLEDFVRGGLQSGECVILISTDAHLSALEHRLTQKGLDLPAARANDQYIDLEAENVLDRFMVKKWPDDKLFDDTVSNLITRGKRASGRVRAFGEMVAVLWARGDNGATVHLEFLWNQLCQRDEFSLFCAYPKAGFTRNATDSIKEICAMHSKVLSS